MHEAVFLNPVPASAVSKRTHKIKSPKLKAWQKLVKKHGGDLKAAAKERKSKARKERSPRKGSGASSRSRTSSGLAARRAAVNPKGGVRMAATKKGRKKTARRKNKVAHLPTTAAWQQRWERATGKKIKKIKKTPKQWLRKYKRKTTPKAAWKVKPMSKSKGSAAGRKRAEFRRAVRAGVLTSTKLNPFTPEQWSRKYTESTGYVPSVRRKKAAPGSKRWWRRTAAGVQSKSKAWYQGALAAANRQIRAMEKGGKRRAANPLSRGKKSRKKRGRNSVAKYRYPMVRSAAARKMMLAAMKRKPKRRRSRRRRNPVQSYLAPALPTYGYVLGGAVAGGVLPSVVTGLARKVGVNLGGYGTAVDATLGVALSLGAGMAVGKYKGESKGVLVAAGGIGTVIGKLLISAVHNMLPPTMAMQGLGADADAMLREAVDVELRKAGLSGMGQFLMPEAAEETPMDGMGQFLTSPEMHEAVGESSMTGMGDVGREDLTDDGSAAFDGSLF